VYLPDNIEGRWATEDIRYADRFFRLSKTSVIFGVGETEIDVYFIADTRFVTLGDDEVVELSIHQKGEENTILSLIHKEGEIETLQLLNQPKVVWHRINEYDLLN